MKKTILITLIGFIFYNTGFSQGIKFEQETFEKALAKAKQENKMVFMDCYTVWCGPCKKLTKEVFPQEEVGAFFNEHFISIKMDMEKGEGIELGSYYNVRSFPTLLFLDAEGEILGRARGFMKGEDLIGKAKEAVKRKK